MNSWPDLTLLPGVSAQVEAARDAVAALGVHPANRRGWPRSAAAAGIRAARASALLDGGSAEVDQSAELIADPVLAGAVRCSAAVAELAPIFGRAPLQALARLHTLAAADLVAPTALGRPRETPGLAERLAGLAQVVTESGWPAPIMAAVVHAEVLTLEPFAVGNGVVARAAARLALVHSGLDGHALTVPEVALLRRDREYRALAADYATGSSAAVGAWLIFSCAALISGAREGRSIADAAG